MATAKPRFACLLRVHTPITAADTSLYFLPVILCCQFYCTGSCQRRHWRKEHRLTCQYIKLLVERNPDDDFSDDDEVGDAPPQLPNVQPNNRRTAGFGSVSGSMATATPWGANNDRPMGLHPALMATTDYQYCTERVSQLPAAKGATGWGDAGIEVTVRRVGHGRRHQPGRQPRTLRPDMAAARQSQAGLSLSSSSSSSSPGLNLPLLLGHRPPPTRTLAPVRVLQGRGPAVVPLAKLQHAGTALKIHAAMVARGYQPHGVQQPFRDTATHNRPIPGVDQ